MSKDQPAYGLNNPHPLFGCRTELIWEGKYDAYGVHHGIDIAGCSMPLQRIETVDEPASRLGGLGLSLSKKAHADAFRNSLIWGDNKLVLSSLINEFSGKIDLVYIDPPFDVGADFTMQLQIGDEGETVQKEQSIIEAIAYRDVWGRGTDSYIHMMYERLMIIHELMSNTSSIYVHCDARVGPYLRLILDEIFGKDNFQNEIIWERTICNALSNGA